MPFYVLFAPTWNVQTFAIAVSIFSSSTRIVRPAADSLMTSELSALLDGTMLIRLSIVEGRKHLNRTYTHLIIWRFFLSANISIRDLLFRRDAECRGPQFLGKKVRAVQCL